MMLISRYGSIGYMVVSCVHLRVSPLGFKVMCVNSLAQIKIT